MKLICPRCRKEVLSEDVNVQGDLAYCKTCNEAFAISSLVEDDIALVDRPLDARSILIREPERLAVALPRGGFRGVGCFFTFFALFWNAITWTFVVVLLATFFAGSLGQAVPAESEASGGAGASATLNTATQGFGVFGLLFMIPFVIVGLVTAVIALYCLFGETSLAMDREQGVFRRKLFRWTYDNSFLLSEITAVRIQEAYRENDSPVYGVGIVLRDRKMPLVFASGLSEDEKAWLTGEVHAFWREMTRVA